jgi:hypothetical protein
METISITRALADLKVLKARYSRALSDLEETAIAIKKGNQLLSPHSGRTEEDFCSAALSQYNKVIDIYDRIVRLKTAIDESNSLTYVTIGKSRMTVQEAITQKNLLPLKEERLSILSTALFRARQSFESAEESNRLKLEKCLSEIRTSGSSLSAKADLEKEEKERIDRLYGVTFVDPLKLASQVQSLTEEVDDFKNNVDFALSESNATTFIQI